MNYASQSKKTDTASLDQMVTSSHLVKNTVGHFNILHKFKFVEISSGNAVGPRRVIWFL
jgi:hypothetical protein